MNASMIRAVFKKYWKLLLSTMLVSALGSASLIALSSDYLMLDTSLNAYVSNYHHPDAVITTKQTTRDRMDDLLAIPGVEEVDARLVGDTVMVSPSGRNLSIRAHSYDDDDFQRFHYWERSDEGEGDPLLVEFNFARDNNIKVGDFVSVKVLDEYRSYRVAGIVSSPETLAARPTDNAWTNIPDFGYVYAPRRLLEKENNPDHDNAMAELNSKDTELSNAKEDSNKQLDDASTQLADAESELSAREKEYSDALDTMREQQQQLNSMYDQLAASRDELDSKQIELNQKQAELNSTRQTLLEQQVAVTEARVTIGSQLSSVQGRIELLRPIQELAGPRIQQLNEQRDKLKEGYASLESRRSDLEEELQQAKQAGEDYTGRSVEEIQAEITIVDAALESSAAALSTIDSVLDSVEEQLAKVTSNLESLESAEAELSKALAEAEDGLQQISDGLKETESYQTQIDDLQAQITSGYVEIRSGQSQVNSARNEMDDRKTEAETQLAEGRSQISDKRTDLESAKILAMTEFSDLEKELEEARSQLSEWQGYQVFCNQFLLRLTEDAPREKTLEAAKAALGDDLVKSSYLYEDSAVKTKIDTNLKPIETMGLFVPMVFFAITLVVVFLFMSLIVRQSRRDIGILRALGFSQASIRMLYCGTNLVVSLGSIVLGSLFGWVLSLYLNARYAAFFPLPEYTNKFDWFRFAQSGLLTIVVGQLATLLSTVIVGRIQPSEAMSRPAPSNTKVPRVVEILTSGASPLVKFSVVSMLRNKLRFAFSAICLAASVMMVFASLSFLAAKVEIMHQLFDDRVHYDYQAYMSKDPSQELIDELNGLGYVRDAEAMKYYIADITFNDITETTSISAIGAGTKHITVYDQDNKAIEVPQSGIVLERHLADLLGASVGDTVRVDSVDMNVAAVSDQHVNRFQFISIDQAKALGESDMGAVLCDVDKEHEQDLVSFMSNKDGYLYSVFTTLFQSSLEHQFSLTDIASWVIIGFAVIIGLVIVINTAQTNLLEQKKELCVLRTLGFQHSALSRHWFVQSLVNYVVACVIGLPAGGYIARTALDQLTTTNIEYPYASGPKEYVITALLVFGYVAISHIIAMRSFRHWDIVEGVKDKE